MKDEPKRNNQKVIWEIRHPNGHSLLSRNQLKLQSLQANNPENVSSTTQAVSDLFSMAHSKTVQGIAAVALHSDGSHYLLVSGSAIDQNIRAAGAAHDLVDYLNKLSDSYDSN